MKTDYEDVWDWRVENDNKPLWTRSPKEVAEADYNDFFKQVCKGSSFVCLLQLHSAALL
jgi:HSP90 family molecular chaperone